MLMVAVTLGGDVEASYPRCLDGRALGLQMRPTDQ